MFGARFLFRSVVEGGGFGFAAHAKLSPRRLWPATAPSNLKYMEKRFFCWSKMASEMYDSFEKKSLNSGVIEDSRAKVYGAGWARKGEDGYAILTAPNATLVGVFDGHGGPDAACFCTSRMLPLLLEDKAFKSGDIKQGLHNVFLKMDKLMRSTDAKKFEDIGTTAVVVVVTDNKIFIAHTGDSYALLFSNNGTHKGTKDHNVRVEAEAERARKAGSVFSPGNQPGNIYSGIPDVLELLMTRALGDLALKANEKLKVGEQICIGVPDVMELDITEDTDFLVLCTDGVCREPHTFIKWRLEKNETNLFTNRDDVTIVLVELKKNHPTY